MAMMARDIDALLQALQGPGEASSAGPALTPEDRINRIQALGPILETARSLWHDRNPELDRVAEKIADASRDSSWRIPLGDSGVLSFFLGLLFAKDLRLSLKIHMMRLIGNACADTDENRARVIEGDYILPLISHLTDDGLLAFVIPVLFNLVVDYEPAQLAGSKAGLSAQLINLVGSPRLEQCQAFLNLICGILDLLASQEPESTVAPPRAPVVLLSLAATPPLSSDIEDFTALLSTALTYLTFPPIQASFTSDPGSVPLLLAALSQAFALDVTPNEDPDVADRLSRIRTASIRVLADLSANPDFSHLHPPGSPVAQTLAAWLRLHNPGIQAAACLALGNLARSDEAAIALAGSQKVHIPLIAILSDPQATDAQLLHAALSLLKNLAIPAQNKPLLGDGGLLSASCLPRLWTLDAQPQVQFAAVSLARLLLVSCPSNVRRICAPLSADPASPAHARTNVSRLIDVFDRADAEPTKTEAARAVAAVCRALHSTPAVHVLAEWEPVDDTYVFRQHALTARLSESPISSTSTPTSDGTGGGGRRESFYKEHARINSALAFLASQTRWPVLRSEALFVFALMCRSRDGALVVIKVMQIHEAFQAILEAITGKSVLTGEDNVQPLEDEEQEKMQSPPAASGDLAEELGLEPQLVDPQQKANMARVDRENGLVLLSELVKNWGEDLPKFRRKVFEDLLKEGGELVAKDREKGKEANV